MDIKTIFKKYFEYPEGYCLMLFSTEVAFYN